MRSVVKITLGIELIGCLIAGLGGVIFALVCLVYSIPAVNEVFKAFEGIDSGTILFIAGIVFVSAVLLLISVLMSKLMIDRLNTAKTKRRLIPLIIAKILTLTWVSTLMIIFSPGKYILNQNSYFE